MIARQAGFRVPHTLVSQDPVLIRSFCAKLHNRVVVKPVKGTLKTILYSGMVTEECLDDEESIRLCPAIYQECIPGTRHVRVQCFGDAVHAVLIESEDLDWRANLDIPFSVIELEDCVKNSLRKVLRLLGLKMGIVDLKFAPDGEVVWFEINPQGQFLFVQGMTGLDLSSIFADFLRREATKGKRKEPRAAEPT
jgi:glutathione synthase/RimK-type ligase-like ATP-grasp enzyme